MILRYMFILMFIISLTGKSYPVNNEINNSLLFAVRKGRLKKVIRLIKNGADKNFKDMCGNTVLMNAVYYFRLNIVKFLLKSGVKLHLKNSEYGWNALMIARARGYKKIERILLRYGAKIN